MNSEIPKTFEPCPTVGSDGKYYVKGPGPGFSRDSGTLYPGLRLSSMDDSVAASKIANIAFEQGVHWAQSQMRKAIGV